MIKDSEQLKVEGFIFLEREPKIYVKRIGRHFLFYNSENNTVFEIDLNSEFKLRKGDKELNSYLNFVQNTPGKKSSAEKYRQKYPDWELELAYECYKLTTTLFMVSPEGKLCYKRNMISTDELYLRGMQAIVEIDTEKILMKHFDNVFSNAVSKGFKYKA